ncbi:MAG: NADP-dependent oxidoreductase [Planctomycetes bacterium]|jgi:NADPH-dependent curcumin reductase CurA|nr:NADP-dependent oxidoreductase [Planctomycetota bacterium]
MALNRQWRLAARPSGLPKESDFSWHEEPVAEPGDGELLVRNLYLSLDPANRGWMTGRKTYIDPVGIGDVMFGSTIAVVESSRHQDFQPGEIVSGFLGWQDYALASPRALVKLPPELPVPLEDYFAVFGHVGMTAYFGLLDVGRPAEGETLVVSAAAGAVGSLVGQLGKLHGCRVVGIAGSDEKCSWLTAELGFDAAVNYRREPVAEALAASCPEGIDVYFDNVGGEILEAALSGINDRARIVVCGMISQYNAIEPPPGPRNLGNLLIHRARMEGFIVLDYFLRASEAIDALGAWVSEGRLRYRVHVVEGLEEAPAALNYLFDGRNEGKLVIKLAEPPA